MRKVTCPVCKNFMAQEFFNPGPQPLATLGWPETSENAKNMDRFAMHFQLIFNRTRMDFQWIGDGFPIGFNGNSIVVEVSQLISNGYSMDLGRTFNGRPTQPQLQNEPTSIEHLSKALWRIFRNTLNIHWESIEGLSNNH